MAPGILEDKYLEKVPGTALLSDLGVIRGHEVVIDEATRLKRGTGRFSHIVLIPQPSDDPNDPLNWPRWKKEACFWILAFVSTFDGALSPMVTPGYHLLSKEFGVSVDEVASSFGAILLGLGCFTFLQNMFATKFGHRIVYFASISLMFIACIWTAASPSLTSIKASRVVQGFGMSTLQSLVPSTIEQIFFVHERGSRSVIWSFCVMSGITLGPLLNSYVIQNLSWQMGFWFVTIPLGLSVIAIFFFVPETTYIREAPTGKPLDKNADSEKQSMEESSSASEPDLIPSPKSYKSQLKLYSGTYTDVSLLKLFFRPFPFLLSPITWFIFLTHAMQTVWLSLIPICSSTIFTIEYNFNATQIGLTSLGGFVGIVIATSIVGPLTDWGTVWFSKRNKGIYEPEFRIIFMLAMLFGVFGYAGWAVGTTQHIPWIGAVICISMVTFSMVVSGSASVTYLLDTHRENSLQILVVGNFGKNMVLYGFTFFVNGMVASRGVKVSLLILASCQAACWLSCIPMYVYGKRVRSFVARHPEFFVINKEKKM